MGDGGYPARTELGQIEAVVLHNDLFAVNSITGEQARSAKGHN
jgi:hypothetical protein